MNWWKMFQHYLVFCLSVFHVNIYSVSAQQLGSYNVDSDAISVSGISSGAAFASQFHVAHASSVMGMGAVATVPYWCSWGNVFRITTCMLTPSLVVTSTLTDQAQRYSNRGKNDPTEDLEGSKVYLIHGTQDLTVLPGASTKAESFYAEFGADIETEFTLEMGHGFPTYDYGNTCSSSSDPFINRCNWGGAFRLLNHIYGGLTEPSAFQTPSSTLQNFDQLEFLSGRLSHSFDDQGFVYIPSQCEEASGAGCRLHVVFHGCGQGREFLEDEFAKNAGYLQVADLNNIILLFPQIKSSFLKGNILGCWDWWAYEYNVAGFLDFDFATKEGLQIGPVKTMVDRVAGL